MRTDTTTLGRTTTTAVRLAAAVVAVVLLAALLVVTRGPAASAAPTLLSQGRPTTASASDSTARTPAKAVDGSTATRWASGRTDAQWLRVDLGRTATVSRVVLRWEAAYAKAYRLEVSSDAKTWRTLSSTTAGKGGVVTTDVSGSGRYVRMLGVQRATTYGYSLWEFQVYGTVTAATAKPTPAPTPSPSTAPSTGVRVTGTQGKWQLTVDGAPWTVRGVTYGPSNADAPSYMADIASTGANTVRTWGTDASSAQLFDAARARGIRVVAGLWLDQGADYVGNTTYKADTLASITKTVTTYRDHGGLLMWDVGNEVMLGQGEAQRVAYAQYVEQVVQAIHRADPGHPVTSTDAWTGAWDYYRQYTPSLDLYAVNSFGGIGWVQQQWRDGGYTKPYLVTETGPAGSWEVPADANGVPRQPTDTAAARAYTDAWRAVTAAPGVALGATMFHYGVENDEPGVWLNLRTDGLKRPSWYAVQQAYRGTVAGNRPPVVGTTTASPSTGVAPGATVTITAPTTDPDGDAVTWRAYTTSRYVDGDGTLRPTAVTRAADGTLRITAPTTAGAWKIAVYALDGHGNVGIGTTSVRVR
ncbi:discoidin domain-containing protein [Curtobacterium caseinilyticum]|uniref:Discoidin domain-containing protein n=1 Tax=Curtobacterium caseinilyticum TaxID=3055137 RepID=A0ABT7TP47_9MICO|nr:discoidin domain-containing protein [Curtobacterium caseinilyticum]MDM7891286.1 discoidin domain-containing protein [Curtobacterium caseinilyticum]